MTKCAEAGPPFRRRPIRGPAGPWAMPSDANRIYIPCLSTPRTAAAGESTRYSCSKAAWREGIGRRLPARPRRAPEQQVVRASASASSTCWPPGPAPPASSPRRAAVQGGSHGLSRFTAVRVSTQAHPPRCAERLPESSGSPDPLAITVSTQARPPRCAERLPSLSQLAGRGPTRRHTRLGVRRDCQSLPRFAGPQGRHRRRRRAERLAGSHSLSQFTNPRGRHRRRGRRPGEADSLRSLACSPRGTRRPGVSLPVLWPSTPSACSPRPGRGETRSPGSRPPRAVLWASGPGDPQGLCPFPGPQGQHRRRRCLGCRETPTASHHSLALRAGAVGAAASGCRETPPSLSQFAGWHAGASASVCRERLPAPPPLIRADQRAHCSTQPPRCAERLRTPLPVRWPTRRRIRVGVPGDSYSLPRHQPTGASVTFAERLAPSLSQFAGHQVEHAGASASVCGVTLIPCASTLAAAAIRGDAASLPTRSPSGAAP